LLLPKSRSKNIFREAFLGLAFNQDQDTFTHGRAPRTFFSHSSPRP
jgi:hypothetical protein